MNFAQLRDALLELAPLDKSHVADVNRAEAAFWKRSQGARFPRSQAPAPPHRFPRHAGPAPPLAMRSRRAGPFSQARVDWSDRILGFECGGQQWVSEVALPCGAVGASDGRVACGSERAV